MRLRYAMLNFPVLYFFPSSLSRPIALSNARAELPLGRPCSRYPLLLLRGGN